MTTDSGNKFEARFWSKVEKTEGCWNWKGYLERKGYGLGGREMSVTKQETLTRNEPPLILYTTKKKDRELELKLITAELHLDGMKSHITMKKENCALYGTAYDKKIRRALTAVRSARDVLRNDMKQKQWTLTTRSKQMNRHGLWEAPWPSGTWKCPFDAQRTASEGSEK